MQQTTNFDFQEDNREKNYQSYGYHCIAKMNGYSLNLYYRINGSRQWVNGNIHPSMLQKNRTVQSCQRIPQINIPVLYLNLLSKCEFHLPTVLQSSSFHSICFKKRICLSSSWKSLYFFYKKEIRHNRLRKKPYFPLKWKHSSLLLFYLMFRS